MGVTGLWTVLQPVARPTKIETLNRKRLAVDASIWIYQFLKAVRDKEGNALRNSHVVGFFRRICKLLFIGIKPVFIFDGGAPALKRQTISARKKRREGRREDAVRTAGKLLAVQMQRRAEEEEQKRREERAGGHVRQENEEEIPDNVVYVDEITMTPKERQRNRKFRKTDQYHLPELDVPLAEMGGPNDPRIMSLEELEQYARQFDAGEDINVYDFSKIDFDSPFFVSLPASDRYNILNAARLRSRLRMGYSKDQLDSMFPDRMAFSKFQIERVRERNELTQRLMNINGMNEDGMWGVNGTSRVSGEKGREYVLVKNDGVEGGWALGVVTNKEEGQRDKPIDVDRAAQQPNDEDESDWDDQEEFEDIPIEGLNRLPKQLRTAESGDVMQKNDAADAHAKRRQQLYENRQKKISGRPRKKVNRNVDSLFVAEQSSGEDEEWEDVGAKDHNDLFEEDGVVDEEEADLRRAIAMSLEQNTGSGQEQQRDEDDYNEVFQQTRVEEPKPFAAGSGLAVARMANARSNKGAVSRPVAESDSEDEPLDLRTALAESRRTKRKRSPPRPPPVVNQPPKEQQSAPSKAPGFDGPLPFEKLDLGSSLLGKKKMKKLEDDQAGGFEKDLGKSSKKKESEPLPPWFAGGEGNDLESGLSKQKATEEEDRRKEREEIEEQFEFVEQPVRLRKENTNTVIDLEAPEEAPSQAVINVDSSEDEGGIDKEDIMEIFEDPELRMGGLADKIRAEPPAVSQEVALPAKSEVPNSPMELDSKSAADEPKSKALPLEEKPAERASKEGEDDEPLEWEESDHEGQQNVQQEESKRDGSHAAGEPTSRREASKSSSPEFEDVAMDVTPASPPKVTATVDSLPSDPLAPGYDEGALPEGEEEEEIYSDPEDEALFQQLAEETAEHARFASSLAGQTANPTSTSTFTAADLDAELKSLRAQQKTSLRDADEVTSTMISECQQLLTLFGLPYMTAPMEAEAQCAELARLGLVDGIVTDDSDAFLFGASRVYKNVFNQAKFVECYLSSDVETDLGLDRQRLVALSELLGSDYADGLPGIGPVTAVELLSEFSTLEDFRTWWAGLQSDPTAQITSKKALPGESSFRRKFRRAHAAKLFLPPAFPDARVADAYSHPDVDADPTPFQWGVPDLALLRDFLMATVGWGRERADEILVPVIRDLNRRDAEGTQANLTRWFDGTVASGTARGLAGRPGQSSTTTKAATTKSGKATSAAAAAAAVAGVPVDGDARTSGAGSKRLLGALGRMRDRDRAKGAAAAERGGEGEEEQAGPADTTATDDGDDGDDGQEESGDADSGSGSDSDAAPAPRRKTKTKTKAKAKAKTARGKGKARARAR